MKGHRWHKILCVVFSVLGLILISAGIALPITLQGLLNTSLNKFWMKTDDSDKWGETPGDVGLKIVRQFMLFNITNLDEIMLGAKPKVIEMGWYPYQEYSKFKDWEYLDDNGDLAGQDVSSMQIGQDRLAYHYELELKPLVNNDTYIPPETPITSFNGVRTRQKMYSIFYPFTHQSFLVYGLWHLYYVVVTLQDQLKDSVTAYVIYNRNFTDTVSTKAYLIDAGLSDAAATELLTDTTYGWGSWPGVKQWVIAQAQVNEGSSTCDGMMDYINNHFQIEGLDALVAVDSLFYNLTQQVYADMTTRYGNNDPTDLANLQFTTLGVLANLPLDLGSLNGTYGPSFLSLNATMGFPELELFVKQQKMNVTSVYPISSSLFEIQHEFPKNNTGSLVNYNNIISFFSLLSTNNFTALYQQFNFTDASQIPAVAGYIQYISGNLDFKGPNGRLDGYSTALAKWSQKAWVNSTNYLEYDAYYGLAARLLFCEYVSQNVTCEALLSQGNIEVQNALLMCQDPEVGWDTNVPSSFRNLQVWTEAALKKEESLAYKTLLSRHIFSSEDLNTVLYDSSNSMNQSCTDLMETVSTYYHCQKSFCTYAELLQLQWGNSSVTYDLLPGLTSCGVTPSLSMQEWFPTHYKQPVEWREVSDLSMDFSGALLSYDSFLNPITLRSFYHEYFKGNYTQVAAAYGLPSSQYVIAMYEFLKSVVPGRCMPFITLTAYELLNGFADPFTLFMFELEIYEGGYPTPVMRAPIATPINDSESSPRHIMYTGLSNSDDTRKYYAYYGAEDLKMYANAYSEYTTAPGIIYANKNIWNGTVPFQGSDGGMFGTHVDKDDTQYVYVDSFRRYMQLEYEDTEHYHDLKLYRMHVNKDNLQTGDVVPENYQFNQFDSGFEGYLNFTSQYGTPLFISLLHCYLCEPEGASMAEHYAFSNDSYMGERIYTHQKHDESYVYIEPYSGAGVRVLLSFTASMGLYRDYFFDYDFYEPVAGKGLYFPYYSVHRSFNYSYDQVQDQFGDLIFALKIQPIARYIGLSVGGFLIVVSLAILTIGYRRYRRHKRRMQEDGNESPILSPYWLSPDATPTATPRETQGNYE
jgi:hypothetical protein